MKNDLIFFNKMLKPKIIMLLLMALLFIGCNNKNEASDSSKKTDISISEGGKFIGKWYLVTNSPYYINEITISLDGSAYLVTYLSKGGLGNKTSEYIATYKNGALNLGNNLIQEIRYSESQNKLFWGGNTFEKK